MFESTQHQLSTPLGTYTFDRNAAALPRAYVTTPADDLGIDRETVRYPYQDVSRVGDGYVTARVLTLVGVLEAADPATFMPERQKIRGLLNSLLRADGVLSWTPFGMSPVQMVVRRHEAPQISARPESGNMVLSLIAADPKVYSQQVRTVSLTPPTSSGGATSPMTSPYYERVTSPAVVVTNQGDATSYPLLRIFGPIDSPRVVNQTTGGQVSFPGLTIAPGDYLEVDLSVPITAFLNGSVLASRYSYLDATVSDAWALAKGDNVVNLYGANYDQAQTRCDVIYQDAWMP